MSTTKRCPFNTSVPERLAGNRPVVDNLLECIDIHSRAIKLANPGATGTSHEQCYSAAQAYLCASFLPLVHRPIERNWYRTYGPCISTCYAFRTACRGHGTEQCFAEASINNRDVAAVSAMSCTNLKHCNCAISGAHIIASSDANCKGESAIV